MSGNGLSEPDAVEMWQTADLSQTYLRGVRGAIPLAQEQVQIMLRLVRHAKDEVHSLLDLGCGDGILGQALLDQHPNAWGVFLDFSQPMLDAARERLSGYERSSFVLADYGQPVWIQQLMLPPLEKLGLPRDRFDVIVSGYSIHHQPDERKRQLYQELYHLLSPGGIFINMEHVASQSAWGQALFDETFIDGLHLYHQRNGSQRSRQEIADEFYARPDKEANILALVETQCDWLRELGFREVDCFFKIFELAIFGGIK